MVVLNAGNAPFATQPPPVHLRTGLLWPTSATPFNFSPAFFACLASNCCPSCGSADFNADGDSATDADIESFFRVLAGGSC